LAKKLLTEAGYPNGFEANFDTPNDRYVNDQQVAEAIAAQLAKVGIKLKVIATPKAVFFPKVDRFESPFMLAGWGTLSWQGTMNSFFRELKGTYGRNNRGRFSDPELEKKMDVSNTIMDDTKRRKVRDEIAEAIYGTYYVIPFISRRMCLVSPGGSRTANRGSMKGSLPRIEESELRWSRKKSVSI